MVMFLITLTEEKREIATVQGFFVSEKFPSCISHEMGIAASFACKLQNPNLVFVQLTTLNHHLVVIERAANRQSQTMIEAAALEASQQSIEFRYGLSPSLLPLPLLRLFAASFKEVAQPSHALA